MVRHGERADNVDNEKMGIYIEQMSDPPLTPLGINQAKECGAFFKKYLEDNGYTKIIVQSSPYLRCLQTAAETCKILGIEKIEVNYVVGEWMKDKFFPQNPINDLLIRNKDPKYIQDKYLDGV